jgi:4-oxalocrotonate tautomerase
VPLIRATLMEGALTTEQKQELIRRLTDATLSVYGETMRPYCWVLVEEVTSGQWGAGGQALTTADITGSCVALPGWEPRQLLPSRRTAGRSHVNGELGCRMPGKRHAAVSRLPEKEGV